MSYISNDLLRDLCLYAGSWDPKQAQQLALVFAEQRGRHASLPGIAPAPSPLPGNLQATATATGMAAPDSSARWESQGTMSACLHDLPGCVPAAVVAGLQHPHY